VSHPLFERHAATLERALTAIGDRGYWSPHSESPKAYGEGGIEAGKAAFDALLDKPFALDQPGTIGTVGREVSPFGIPLGVTYPKPDLDKLFAAVAAAEREWRKAGTRRVGRRRDGSPAADQQAKPALRQRRDAHDRARRS
jgi:hypothetical protein